MGSDMGQKKAHHSELLKLCGVFLAGCLITVLLFSSGSFSTSDCLVSFGTYKGSQYSIDSTLSTKCLVESKFMKLQQHSINLEGNVISDWLWIDYHDRINVLVEPSPGQFLVFEQTKYALEQRHSLAIIGGIIEPGEASRDAAQREVLEETKLTCSEWIALGRYRTDVNRGVGWTHTFLACDCQPAEPPKASKEMADEVGVADTEQQDLHTMTLQELHGAVRNGEFLEIQWSATVALALLYYHDKEREG